MIFLFGRQILRCTRDKTKYRSQYFYAWACFTPALSLGFQGVVQGSARAGPVAKQRYRSQLTHSAKVQCAPQRLRSTHHAKVVIKKAVVLISNFVGKARKSPREATAQRRNISSWNNSDSEAASLGARHSQDMFSNLGPWAI